MYYKYTCTIIFIFIFIYMYICTCIRIYYIHVHVHIEIFKCLDVVTIFIGITAIFIHYKSCTYIYNRVLDLVDQFIRFQSSNPLMLVVKVSPNTNTLYINKHFLQEFLVPLFKVCISYRSHKILSPLSERCTHVLEKLCRVKTVSMVTMTTYNRSLPTSYSILVKVLIRRCFILFWMTL